MVERSETLIGGRYRLLSFLGSGGTGEVYQALQLPLERVVALKLLRPTLGADPALRRRFGREARAVAALNHPHITTVYDFGLTDHGLLYLAMEYIDGQSLRALIEEGLPTIPALVIVEQILSGLAHAHARGLIHRDLKPANVLVSRVDDQVRAKIVDFGIAAVAGGIDDDQSKTPTSKVIGTPRYMSPEQAQGDRNLNHSTDLYNVGLMLYELAAGRHPFTARTPRAMMLQHCTAPVPRPLPRPGFVMPAPLEEIILRSLSKDPAERFASAAEMRNAVAAVRRSLEDRGHALYLPVAPAIQGEPEGRITLVEGTPRVVSPRPTKMAHALEAPLVDRLDDRTFLDRISERVCEQGQGGIVILEGETGVGKTRLATWLKEQVVESGSMRSLAGRYLRESQHGLRGIREAIEQLFGTRGLATAQASERVVSQLLSWGLRDARDAGLLIQTIRPPEPEPSAPSPSVTATESLFAAICRALQAATDPQPVLLILDDVQWAGPGTAEFLEYLAGELRTRPFPLLLVCTLRSEDLPANPRLAEAVSNLAVHDQDTVFRRRIRRMTDDDVKLLIRHVLPAHDSLAEALARRAEGNPLYALQILRYLVDENLVTPTETGSYVATEGVRVEEMVPPNLSDLLLLRLLQLERRHGPGRRLVAVLERAAVLGSRFSYDALTHMVSEESLLDREQLDRVLDDLVDEGLLSQSPNDSEDLLDFGHSLLRDVLLKHLAPRRSTRRLHHLAAGAKRRVYAGREELVAQQLSAHYELARSFPEALRYAHMAAITAERMYVPASAIAAWHRFLRLYDRVEEAVRADLGLPDPDEVRVRLGELQESLGSYPAAEKSFRHLVPDDQAELTTVSLVRAVIGLAVIALKRGRALQARAEFARALAAAQTLEAAGPEARATLGLAQVAWHHGQAEQARTEGRRALEKARSAEDPIGQANALWFLGDVARLTGDLDEGEEHFRAALAIFESLDEPRGVARCLYGLALVARSADHLDQAEALFQSAFDTLKPLGVRRGLAHCLNGLGEVARFRHRPTEARDFYRRAVDLYQSAGLPTDAAVSLTNLGLVARDAGDLQGARDAMERALRVAEAASYRYLTLGIALNLAWVYALLGERRLCQKMLDEHLDKALKFGVVDPDFARPLEGIAELLDAAGETREARQLFERAREMWEELRRDRDASRVAALLR